jgi:hypothetical protein
MSKECELTYFGINVICSSFKTFYGFSCVIGQGARQQMCIVHNANSAYGGVESDRVLLTTRSHSRVFKIGPGVNVRCTKKVVCHLMRRQCGEGVRVASEVTFVWLGG